MTRYSDEELIEELQRLADEIGRVPRAKDMRKRGKFSARVYEKRFGSWNDSLRQAGLEPNVQYDVPGEELIEELQRLGDKIGRAPRKKDMTEHGKFGHYIYRDRFGSWNNSLRKAGFEPSRQSGITHKELIDELQRLANEIGRTPRQKDMNERGKFSVMPYISEFGSWNNALKVADMEPNVEQGITREELIEEIHHLKDKLGRVPKSSDVREMGNFSMSSFLDEFGSWNNSLRESGFNPNVVRDASDEELIEDIQRVAEMLGRVPHKADMDEHGEFHGCTYKRRFGTWNKALEAAGFEPNVERNISEEKLIEDIKRVSEIIESTPAQSDMVEHSNYSLCTFRDRFGTWNNSLEAAGFDTWTPPVGEDHPQYKGDYDRYYGPNFEDQRHKCLKRDNYECQSCGTGGESLHCHHITPRDEFVDEDGNYDWEEANRLENLVMLCDSCHPRLEGKYQDFSADEFAILAPIEV